MAVSDYVKALTQSGRASRRRLSFVAVAAMLAALLGAATPAAAQTQEFCGGQRVTIMGTSGDDVLNGTPGRDVIAALGGDDTIYGRAGNDIICAGHGNDSVFGGDGADTIYAFNGADHLQGGAGPDLIFGGFGKDVLWGGNGQDVLKGGPGVDALNGGAQRDTLLGGLHVDTLVGGTELDTCFSPGDILDCERGGGQNTPAVAGPVVTDSVINTTAQYEAEMFRLINVERGKVSNIGNLTRNADLDAYARDWAVVMSQQPLPLSTARHHSPAFTGSNIPFRGLPTTINWTTAYENVGYSTVGNTESAADVLDRLFYAPNGAGFMSSPGHRCNILETAVSQVGVGSYVDSSGDLWVVQVFWGTSSPVPAAISSCSSTTGR